VHRVGHSHIYRKDMSTYIHDLTSSTVNGKIRYKYTITISVYIFSNTCRYNLYRTRIEIMYIQTSETGKILFGLAE